MVGNKNFEVEVIEVSQNKFEVTVNGKKAVIELKREIDVKRDYKTTKETKKEKRGEKAIKSPMVGVVTKILKKEGESVKIGENVAVIEAMKMENPISSPFEGVVEKILVKLGQKVSTGDTLMILA